MADTLEVPNFVPPEEQQRVTVQNYPAQEVGSEATPTPSSEDVTPPEEEILNVPNFRTASDIIQEKEAQVDHTWESVKTGTFTSDPSTRQEIMKVAEGMDNAWKNSMADAVDVAKGIPIAVNRIKRALYTGLTGLENGEDNEWATNTTKYLSGLERELRDEATLYRNPDQLKTGVTGKVFAGLAAAPATVGTYMLPVATMGPVTGMATVDALRVADENLGTILKEGVKGAAMGGVFKGLSYTGLPQRVGLLGAAGFGASSLEGGRLEDNVAAGITWATLGVFSGPKQYTQKQMKRINAEQEYFDLLKTRDYYEANVEAIQRAFPTDKIRQVHAGIHTYTDALRTVTDALNTKENLSDVLSGVDLRNPRDVNVDLHQKYRVVRETKDGEEVVDVFTPRYKDSEGLGNKVWSYMTPGKFRDHPLTKWVVDQTDKAKVSSEFSTDKILHGLVPIINKYGTVLRAAGLKKTDHGMLTRYEQLPTEASKTKVRDAAWWAVTAQESKKMVGRDEKTGKAIYEDITIPDEALIKEWKLNEQELAAYRGIRQGLDTVHEMYNRSLKEYGGEGNTPLPYLHNYLPAQWTGDFRVAVRNKKGTIIHMVGANTSMGAKSLLKGLKDKFVASMSWTHFKYPVHVPPLASTLL